MKKYKHRHLKTINRAITVAYLITAIAWGVCACNFNENRNELKQQYIAEEITKEEFLKLSHEKTLKEEKIFNGLATMVRAFEQFYHFGKQFAKAQELIGATCT